MMPCRNRSFTTKTAFSTEIAVAYCIAAMAVLAVYHLVAEGEVSSTLTMAAIVQCLGISFLCMQVFSSGTAAGISVGSLLLDALAICFRLSSTLWLDGYLPVDKSGDYIYQAVDVCSLILLVWLLYYVCKVKGSTYQANEDSFRVCPAVIISLGFAAILHANMDEHPLFDTFWMTGLFLGVVAVLPQLWLIMQNGGQAQALTSHYIAALAVSRVLSGAFMWMARDYITCDPWFESVNHGLWTIMAAHVIHLILLGDFAYHYIRAVMQNGVIAPIALGEPCWV